MNSRLNIVLIGMMGVGKSTVGKGISELTGMPFIDMDHLIEERMNMSIPEIFEKYGEAGFRRIESEVAVAISEYEGHVISTGGGVMLNSGNVKALKRNGVLIYLEASVDKLIENLRGSAEGRPLLSESDLHKKITRLLGEREDIYSGCSDYTIETDGKDVKATIEAILEYMNKL